MSILAMSHLSCQRHGSPNDSRLPPTMQDAHRRCRTPTNDAGRPPTMQDAHRRSRTPTHDPGHRLTIHDAHRRCRTPRRGIGGQVVVPDTPDDRADSLTMPWLSLRPWRCFQHTDRADADLITLSTSPCLCRPLHDFGRPSTFLDAHTDATMMPRPSQWHHVHPGASGRPSMFLDGHRQILDNHVAMSDSPLKLQAGQ